MSLSPNATNLNVHLRGRGGNSDNPVSFPPRPISPNQSAEGGATENPECLSSSVERKSGLSSGGFIGHLCFNFIKQAAINCRRSYGPLDRCKGIVARWNELHPESLNVSCSLLKAPLALKHCLFRLGSRYNWYFAVKQWRCVLEMSTCPDDSARRSQVMDELDWTT